MTEPSKYIIYGDFAVCTVSNDPTLYFLIDTKNIDLLQNKRWYMYGLDDYPICNNSKEINNGKQTRLHILVAKRKYNFDTIPENLYVDHINRCKYDNRECNIRLVTIQYNCINKSVSKNSISGFTGIRKLPNGKYRPQLMINGKTHTFGTYEKIEDAITARMTAEVYFENKFYRDRFVETYYNDMVKFCNSLPKPAIYFTD